ncbi:MAG: hypothetical protein QF704_15765, partial [Anaerolineales bacterium]|nr:hypothetical protein [Anaerolineales bacterium]
DISNNQATAANQVLEIAALTNISNNTGALTDISNNQASEIAALTDISSNQQAVIARLDGTTGSKILDMNLNLVNIVNKLVDGNNMKLIRKNQEGKCFCAQRPWDFGAAAGVFSNMLSIVNPASSTKNLYFYSYSSTAYFTGYFEEVYIISGTPTSGTDVSCNILNSSNDVSGNTSVAVAKANPTYTLGSDDYIVDIENAKDNGTSSVNVYYGDCIIIEAGKGIFVRVRPIAENEYSCLFKWYEE